MGIKKIARPINAAKNKFVQWLKDNNADNIDVYSGEDDGEWTYYRCVSAFVDDNIYTVYFMIWESDVKIDYSDEDNKYSGMSVDEFIQLLWLDE